MKITIEHLFINQSSLVDERLFERLEILIGNLDMKLSEIAAKVTAQAEIAEKVVTEIQALKDALSDVELPQSAIDAFSRLDAALTTADDLNADVAGTSADPVA